jgi:hypothetical protein
MTDVSENDCFLLHCVSYSCQTVDIGLVDQSNQCGNVLFFGSEIAALS